MAQKHKKPRGFSVHSSARTHRGFLSLSFFLSFHPCHVLGRLFIIESRVPTPAAVDSHAPPAVVLRNFLKSHHAPQSAHKSPFSPISERRSAAVRFFWLRRKQIHVLRFIGKAADAGTIFSFFCSVGADSVGCDRSSEK
jgi:hypothetical protein